MEKDHRYLVKRYQNSQIKEILCLEVSKTSLKIQELTRLEYSFLITSSDKPYWILQDDISTVAGKEFYIIEDLGEFKQELITNSEK